MVVMNDFELFVIKIFLISFLLQVFRWDFLLYSVMPIWLGWYVIIKSKNYIMIILIVVALLIYCRMLFGIMLIRASFSNRFAYLSWFMYPIVLAYLLLILPVWRLQ